uniref:FeoB-associated Cys-rich membrane protein n=1 Tax=Dulem virus 37 TaxID=3145755 RepID=A0AAU8AW85_9CAUD
MVEVITNAVLAVLIIVLHIIWIISLIRWDGKCHCDKSKCSKCPYSGSCNYENTDE